MFRSFGIILVLIGFVLPEFQPCLAQGRGGLSSGWGGVDLLLNPVVQKELGLDDAATRRAIDLAETLQDRQRVIFGKLEGLAGDERTRKAHELAREHATDGLKAVQALLPPDQFERFRQIDLQQRGASALVDPLVIGALQLSTVQVDQVQGLLDRSVLKFREALSNTRSDRRTSAEKIQVVRTDLNAQAVNLLTEPQKARWNEMIGRPINLGSTGRP